MKRKLILLIFLCIFSVCFSACDFLPKEQSVATSLVQPQTETSNTYVAKKGNISESIKCSGKFSSSSQQALCFTQRGGVIGKINVKNGDTIKKGDVIAELIGDESSQDLKDQEFQLKKAEETYNDLVATNANKEDIEQASIDLQIQQLRYDSIQKELNKYMLVSPIDGKIAKMNKANAGETVQPNEPVVVVADTNSIHVECEYLAAKDVCIGTKATITYNGAELQGQVVKIVPRLDSDDKLHLIPYVVLSISSIPSSASLDDTVNISFESINKNNVIVIPKNFVTSSGDTNAVVVLKNNKRISTNIKLGIQNDTMTEVISGINEGDKIVY